jgi:hypothetical protein
MALAFGDKVSEADKAKCSNVQFTKETTKTVAAPPPVVKPPPPVRTAPHTTRPEWVDRLPSSEGDILYGTGVGANLQHGFQQAIVVIASQLAISVKSSMASSMTEDASESYSDGKQTSSDTRSSESLTQASQSMVNSSLEDVKLMDQWVDKKEGKTWVLASFDRSVLKKKKQVVIDQAFAALADASAKLAAALSDEAGLDQAVIFEAMEVVDFLRGLGKTKMGKKVKKEWKAPLRKFKKRAEKVLDCVQVTGEGFGKRKRTIKKEDGTEEVKEGFWWTKKIRKGDSKLRVSIKCNGRPIIDANMLTSVRSGVMNVQEAILTDEKGQAVMPLGRVFGRGEVQLSFAHNIGKAGVGLWLGDELEPAPKASVAVRATNPANVSLKISGVKGEELTQVRDSIENLLSKKWGANVKKRGAVLQAAVRVDFSPPASVSQRYAQSAELQIAIQSKKGSVFDRKAKAGKLADSKKEAREGALGNLLRRISRW